MRKIVVPRAAQRADVVPEIGPVLRIEPRARLVQEQHLGLVHDPERDVEPSALPAGIGLDPAVRELVQVEDLHQLLRPRAHRGQVAPVETPLEDEVLASGGELVGAAELAHVPDPLADRLGWRATSIPATVALPAVDRQQRRQHPQGRRLAGSVRAEEAEDLSLSDLDADSAHRLDGSPPRVEAACAGRWSR